MHRAHLLAPALALFAFGCSKSTAPGTVAVDWTPSATDGPAPTAMTPAKKYTRDVIWNVSKGKPVHLRFDIDVGELKEAGLTWHKPMHVRITYPEGAEIEAPHVNCMSAPAGTKVGPGGVAQLPLGQDGKTPIAKVACFFNAKEPDQRVFEIDGDGFITDSKPSKP